MLLDHEELYSNPHHYDLQVAMFVEDISFYQDQVAKYGDPVLELGCGTGRITIPIACKGWKTTGLEFSDAMLKRARSKAKNAGAKIEWIKGDFRDFNLDRRFNLILFPFNSFLHLQDRESFEACFRCVQNHLAREGRFIMDIFNPDLEILSRNPDKQHFDFEFPNPDGRGSLISATKNDFDKATQINHIQQSLYFRDEKWTYKYDVRVIYPREFEILLHYNGFEIEEKFGNFDGSAFTSYAPKQIVICKAM